MKRWQGVSLGVAAYLIFLVATAPAARLWPLLQSSAGPLQLSGIDGTVWSGSAALAVAGPVQLESLHWTFRPLALLRGATEVALTARLLDRELQARAGKGWFGHPYLADVRGSVRAADVLRWARVGQASVQGMVVVDLKDVQWSEARVPVVAGSLSWSPATVVAPVELSFGSAQLELQAGEAGSSQGKLVTHGGTLLVEADLSLAATGAYRLDAAIRQEGDVAAGVGNFLTTFAEYRNGSYYFEWSDSL